MIDIDILLKEKGLSKQDLAKKMEISRENLYRILNGNPTLQNLEKIATALEVQIYQLFPSSNNALTGFVEYRGTIHRIKSKADLDKLSEIIKE